jgi:S-DNA-T family DNA segregation ATPase FtsK/SpoIIIE
MPAAREPVTITVTTSDGASVSVDVPKMPPARHAVDIVGDPRIDDDGPRFEVIMNARSLALAWLCAFAATGTDEDGHPLYCRALVVEVYDTGALRFIGTDGALLLHVATDDLDLDELPALTVVVADPAYRMRALLKHVLKLTSEDGEAPDLRAVVSATSGADTYQPALAAELEPQHLIVDIGRERVALDLLEVVAPDWRNIVLQASRKARAADFLGLNTARLAKLHNLPGCMDVARLTPGGRTGAMRLEVGPCYELPHTPLIAGVLMPVTLDLDDDPGPAPDDPAHHAEDATSTAGPRPADDLDGIDPELIDHAAELVVLSQLGSANMIGRKLHLGKARAAAIMAELERRGIVGPGRDRAPRPVLITAEEWQARQERAGQ